MRILQLIDSLNPGGAERMALNYYLALKERNISSFIAVTREKGILSNAIENDVSFLFLQKKTTLDISSFLKLRKYIIQNRIDYVHAHGSSWFWAVLCKLSGSKIKLVWHDHYGGSNFLNNRQIQPLKFFSRYFDTIISVNTRLEKWAYEKLKFKKQVVFLPNFVKLNEAGLKGLKGKAKFKIVCVANFRYQKDHFNLFKAYNILSRKFSVSLHLIGKDFQDSISTDIKNHIESNDEIYFYGEVDDVSPYIKTADLGVLASRSEGFPLTLLEYGLCGLPVVCTDVGDCSEILGCNGRLAIPENSVDLAEKITKYLNDIEGMKSDTVKLQLRINELFSEEAVLDRYLKLLKVI